MSPEHIFLKIVWRHVCRIGEGMEKFTTWTITGIAAILALIVSNLQSVNSMVSSNDIQIIITLFVISLVAGVISKQVGMALSSGLKMTDEIKTFFETKEGQDILRALSTDSAELSKKVAEAFIWPLSTIMRRSFMSGTVDPVRGDKKMVKLFCVQLYFNFAHILLGAAALILIAVFLK